MDRQDNHPNSGPENRPPENNRLRGYFPDAQQANFDDLFHPPTDIDFPVLRAEEQIFEAYREMKRESRGFVTPLSKQDVEQAEILKTLANQEFLENAIHPSNSGGILSVRNHRVFLEPRMKLQNSNNLHSSLVHLKNSDGQSLIMFNNIFGQPRWQNFRHGPVLMIVHGQARLGGAVSQIPMYSEAAFIGELRHLKKVGAFEQLARHPHEASYVHCRIAQAVSRWAEIPVASPQKLFPMNIVQSSLTNPRGTSYDITIPAGEFRAVVERDSETCLIRVTGGRKP